MIYLAFFTTLGVAVFAWFLGLPERETPGPHLSIKAEIQDTKAKRLKLAQETCAIVAEAAE